jgi:ABC-type dipeptide/oligopeptide/nickel transport system permease component
MNETMELIIAVVIFIVAAGVIVGLMIYWSRNETIVDERDKKYYKKEVKNEKS